MTDSKSNPQMLYISTKILGYKMSNMFITKLIYHSSGSATI